MHKNTIEKTQSAFQSWGGNRNFENYAFHKFWITVAAKYREIVGDAFLESIFGLAETLAVPYYIQELSPGQAVHVKYWLPRRPRDRFRTLWHNKIKIETAQYIRFFTSHLPVVEFVVSGVRRFPATNRGSYINGFLVTAMVPGGFDLRNLYKKQASPWMMKGQDCRHQVLRDLGRLLARIHQSGVFHGDYMLKNIAYSKCFAQEPYRLMDLASGGILHSGPGRSEPQRFQDMLRMSLCLARIGLSQSDTLGFFQAYAETYYSVTGTVARDLAKGLMDSSLSLGGHRAMETVALFRKNPLSPDPASTFFPGKFVAH